MSDTTMLRFECRDAYEDVEFCVEYMTDTPTIIELVDFFRRAAVSYGFSEERINRYIKDATE